MRTILATLLSLLLFTEQATAFIPAVPGTSGAVTKKSSTSQLFLFDFFLSEEERQAKAAEKQRIIEEQEALQREILERRVNPDKMAEYENRVHVRRSAYMNGEDGNAKVASMLANEDSSREN
jgi:hypothetical protein